jgi:hypothetical protein
VSLCPSTPVAAVAGPRIKREVEQLIVRMARENRDWGYDRIAGALANLEGDRAARGTGGDHTQSGEPDVAWAAAHDRRL